MKKLVISLCVIICSLPALVIAEDLKVQRLARMCTGEDEVLTAHGQPPIVSELMCISWIGGFLSAMIFADAASTLEGRQSSNQICAPDEGVEKPSQLKDVLVKLSKEKPEIQHASARSVLFGVVKALYACKK